MDREGSGKELTSSNIFSNARVLHKSLIRTAISESVLRGSELPDQCLRYFVSF